MFSDPRVKDWFLMSGPGPTLLICLAYAFFVKVVGPKFMEKRKPFQLRKTLIIYNFLQVVFSAWIFYEVCITIMFVYLTINLAGKNNKVKFDHG